MASILLGSGLAALGSHLAGPMGYALGWGIGSSVGKMLDYRLLHGKQYRVSDGPRLHDLTVQTSTYGRMIPLIYGRARIAGNIIWSMKIKEHKLTSNIVRGQFSGVNIIHNGYSYSITLAIALGEGPIDYISRAWADSKLLDLSLSRYRFYPGDEEQLPDPLIEAEMGVGRTPAYRGLAYMLIEDFPLAEFGNRIPNFTFEVNRRISDNSPHNFENMVRNIVLAPALGEFVYDTDKQSKIHTYFHGREHQQSNPRTSINSNNAAKLVDIELSLKQLNSSFPNLSWVAAEICWFAKSTDLEHCQIRPAVEYQNADSEPAIWQVGRYQRANAMLLSEEWRGGGTVNDQSLLKLLAKLRQQNKKILLRPNIFIDLPQQPHKREITGKVSRLTNFFQRDSGYNQFILHYAQLVKGQVDAFLIGGDLAGISRLGAAAIAELKNLAKQVKTILGPKVLISYAAGWAEHADPAIQDLWRSSEIDFVAIEAFVSAEQPKLNIALNKPIWFTALGFPSIEQAQSKSELFYQNGYNHDKNPQYAQAKVSFYSQKLALQQALFYWQKQANVEHIFVYAWDPRPFPSYPTITNLWKDNANWEKNYVLNGKLSYSSLSSIIKDLLNKVNLKDKDVYLAELTDIVEGLAITQICSLRRVLEMLMQSYGFRVIESAGKLSFLPEATKISAAIKEEELVGQEHGKTLQIKRLQEADLPQKLEIIYLDRGQNYQLGVARAEQENLFSKQRSTIQLPLILEAEQAQNLAWQLLIQAWRERVFYQFALSSKYLYLQSGEVLSLITNKQKILAKIIEIELVSGRKINIKAVSCSLSNKPKYNHQLITETLIDNQDDSHIYPLQLPHLPFDQQPGAGVYFAATGIKPNWRGVVIEVLNHQSILINDSSIAYAQNILPPANSFIIDRQSQLLVTILHGSLISISQQQLLNWQNLALLGEEIIQFMNAELLKDGRYKINGFLRGRLGTEHKIHSHKSGEKLIMLKPNIAKLTLSNLAIGQKIIYHYLSLGQELEQSKVADFSYQATELKPLAPVHPKIIFKSNGDVHFLWIARDRLVQNWLDQVEVTINEAKLKFIVEIYNQDQIKLREFIVDQAFLLYPFSLIIKDFPKPKARINLKIYQWSEIVGRGGVLELNIVY